MKFTDRKPLRGIKNNQILTKWQKKFLFEFSLSELKNIYRLSGGTALSAFYLEHRLSDDLDFFSDKKLTFYEIEPALKKFDFISKINFTKLYDRNIFILTLNDGSILKTEFTYYPFKNLEETFWIDSMQIDSFNDIVLNKFCAIADRTDIKDYVDIYIATKDNPESLYDFFEASKNKCEIDGIHHILKYKLLNIPSGIEKLILKVKLSCTDIGEFFNNFVKNLVELSEL